MKKVLDSIWNQLEEEKYIFTKHNYSNVYNFAKIKEDLKNKVILTYINEKYGIKSLSDFKSIYDLSSPIQKQIIDSEIEDLVKKDPLYKETLSQLKRVNKYKSKAYELLIKTLLDEFYFELNGENEFLKIFESIEEELREKRTSFFEFKNSFNFVDISKDKDFTFKTLNFKDDKVTVGFPKYTLDIEYNKGEILSKDFFNEDKKEYLFQINLNFPFLKLKNGYLFFYEIDGQLKYTISPNYDEIIKKHILQEKKNINKQYYNQYVIKATPKQFKELFYTKSKFLKDIKKKSIVNNFKFLPLIKDYNYKERPDMWVHQNGELIFIEVKFNEYTDFSIESINNTINYVNKFNKICERNKSNLKVDKINIIHNEKVLSQEIMDEIEKKRKRYDINLISIYDLLKDFETENKPIPSKVKVFKEKNKTERIVEFSFEKPKNIIIDLTEVTK